MRYSAEVIGNNIKKCREERKMTQDALGNKIGVTGKQISNYEKGKLTPPTDVLFNLCREFDCELGYLLGEEDYSEGTKLKTAISKELGLSIDAINSVIKIKEKEKDQEKQCPCYEKYKYMEILNKLLQTEKFIDLIEGISRLDKLYIKCGEQINGEKTILDHLEQNKSETLDIALDNWDVSEHDHKTSDFNNEEIKAINDVNDLIDTRMSIEEIKSEMKYDRFLIQESLTLLLEQLYPHS